MVRHMGGDMVVLTFKDTEERDTMFNEGRMAWLTEWFKESYKWENTKTNPCSRLVWLNCYGIPLHLWNYKTFTKIGRNWGEVIMLADETIKNLSFAVGKVLISTTTMDPINRVVELENNGSLTQIRVMEEQLVVNTVLRTECACPGCQVETVEAVEISTIHKSQGDSRLQISPDKLTIKLSSQKENGEKIKDKTPRIEEMVEEIVESTSSTVEAVPSLLGPHPTLAGKLLHSVTVNSMQLVPFIGHGCFK